MQLISFEKEDLAGFQFSRERRQLLGKQKVGIGSCRLRFQKRIFQIAVQRTFEGKRSRKENGRRFFVCSDPIWQRKQN